MMMDVLKSAAHPWELIALIKVKLGRCEALVPKHDYVSMCQYYCHSPVQ